MRRVAVLQTPPSSRGTFPCGQLASENCRVGAMQQFDVASEERQRKTSGLVGTGARNDAFGLYIARNISWSDTSSGLCGGMVRYWVDGKCREL